MKNQIKIFFYILLITPLLAYIYTVWLGLPKSILIVYQFYILFIGIILILKYKIKYVPNYIWFLLIYAVYRFVLGHLNLESKHYLTMLHYSTYNFSTAFLIIIIYHTKFSDNFIEKTISIFKITVLLAVTASFIQIFYPNFLNAFPYFAKAQTPDIGSSLYQVKRLAIFGFADLNELGQSYIPFASVIIGYLFHNKLKSYIYLIILVGITALVSNERYVIVGFLILTIQYVFYFKNKFTIYIRFIFIFSLLILSLYYIITIIGYDFYDWYNKRLLAEGSIVGTTRYKAIGNFLYFFPKYVIWGTGIHYNTPGIALASASVGSSQIHVGYLAHLVSFGVFGSFFYFGFLFLLAKDLFTKAKLTNYWGSFFAFLIYFWAQTTLVFHSIFFTGLIFALIFDKYYYDKYREFCINFYKYHYDKDRENNTH